MRPTILTWLIYLLCFETANGQILNGSNYDLLVPAGKEVDAIYGDYALNNSLVKAIIADPLDSRKANMTVGSIGGCLIDFTNCKFESDQLSAFYPGSRKFPFSNRVIQDNSIKVISPGKDKRPQCTVVYELNEKYPIIHITSTFLNTTSKDWQVVLQDEIRLDGQKEEIRKSKTSDELNFFFINDVYWQQAYGFYAKGYTVTASSDQRTSRLTYRPLEGSLPALKPGESFQFKREIVVHRNLTGLIATRSEATGIKLNDVSFVVQNALANPVANCDLEIRKEGQFWGLLRTDENGEISTKLEMGKYKAKVVIAGRTQLEHEFVANSGENNVSLVCENYSPGRLSLKVVDNDYQPIPAKIEFLGGAKGSGVAPHWGPDSADFFVRNLAYTPNGIVDVELQSGRYTINTSHGPEFNSDSTSITIEPGQNASRLIQLQRVVDTTGWISADFHSHSSPSGDNTGSQLGRVLNLAAEHIEFAPCTEHNRIDTYSDEIAKLQLSEFLATETGMELTGQPLPLNHQNVFPLKMVPRTQDNGGPLTDADPEQQMERVTLWDDRSEKLVQQNHPDIGWLFYDKNGDGQPDRGFSRSLRLMDVMEIHPIDTIIRLSPFQLQDGKPKGNAPMFNWLQLLNQGYRIYGVVNTDAHYNFHGSGWLRNWIQSPTDNPKEIDPMDVVRAAEQGRLIMSNGPFLKAEFTTEGDDSVYVSGQRFRSSSGKIKVRIQVQCPDWISIERVFVLINGRLNLEHYFNRSKDDEMFTSGVVRFDETLELHLKEDSNIIVVAGNRDEKIGSIYGPTGGQQYPAALTNPVFVNVGETGFTVNKDTLDYPLPVKFSSERAAELLSKSKE